MGKTWNYAELSKAAKMAGGPEKYVEALIEASKKEGVLNTLPWIGVAAAGASLLTVATMKVIDFFKAKKQKEIEAAKKELIEGIKKYDEEHPSDDKDDDGDCGGIPPIPPLPPKDK